MKKIRHLAAAAIALGIAFPAAAQEAAPAEQQQPEQQQSAATAGVPSSESANSAPAEAIPESANSAETASAPAPADSAETGAAPAPVPESAQGTAARPARGDAPQPSGSEQYSGLITFALLFIILYMLFIRPQRKAQKEQQARINSLKVGSKVITNAGIHGVVRKVSDATVGLEIASGLEITLQKEAIAHVLNAEKK
ncbi:MAG: preprotein translocase subunit YajC [Akkermansiaceae bacterium]|nr:preprotein translocase subunit YajC [Akkermansiaceae bacterium]